MSLARVLGRLDDKEEPKITNLSTVGVGDAEGVGVGVGVGVAVGVGDAEGVGIGVGFFAVELPTFFHFKLLPDFEQRKLSPFTTLVWPDFLQIDPDFIEAATEGNGVSPANNAAIRIQMYALIFILHPTLNSKMSEDEFRPRSEMILPYLIEAS